MSLRILICGGTFDKEYDELSGKLFFRNSHVNEMLKLGRSKLKVKLEKVFMIDSLEMTTSHRKHLLKKCMNCKEDRIVITHGTDTMVESAKVIGQAQLNKTIVFTGAMVPYKFGSSDGLFNLGASLAFAQTLKPGVYVAMNGRYFRYDHVLKDKNKGIFKAI
jgi:L-asparaginase